VRTTVDIPDDVYQVARSVAQSKGLSIGEAVAQLVRRGLNLPGTINDIMAFPSFGVPCDAEPITLEQVLRAEDEF
jgi:hypothetical protein